MHDIIASALPQAIRVSVNRNGIYFRRTQESLEGVECGCIAVCVRCVGTCRLCAILTLHLCVALMKTREHTKKKHSRQLYIKRTKGSSHMKMFMHAQNT